MLQYNSILYDIIFNYVNAGHILASNASVAIISIFIIVATELRHYRPNHVT